MSIIQGNSKTSAAGGYTIDQSIRFNFSDAAHLLRTPSTASNRRTWTWSLWVKRSGLGNPGGPNQVHMLFGVGAGSCLRFTSSDQLRLETPAGHHTFVTSQVFRDTSAWYHIVLAFDSTQATDTDRRKLYVNGSQVTDFSSTTFTGLAQNAEWDINSTSQHQIAKSNLADYFGGYLAELNFVDGQALAPTEFGETNADTGQWVPVRYTGSYGTNGFYITGADSADLGADDSGNGNDWTSSGLAANDQVTDTPTDNFCTWSGGLRPTSSGTQPTYANGNLQITGGNDNASFGTIFPTSGKWYFEFTSTTADTSANQVGIISESAVHTADLYDNIGGNHTLSGEVYSIRSNNGDKWSDGASASYGSAWGAVTVSVALDLDNQKVWFGPSGTYPNSGDPAAGTNAAFTSLTAGEGFSIFHHTFNNGRGSVNCGQQSFVYTPPTGFNAWSTASLDDPITADPSAYFQTTTYTGDGSSSHEINQTGNSTFEPSMVWIKSRSATTDHVIQDQVRGNFVLFPNLTNAEGATGGGWVSSFDSDGFTVNVNAPINASSATFVAWQWKAAGSGSSNTDGATSSTVSADTTSGFSIVTWTGTASNTTVGHGLGVAPQMIIIKNRADVDSWVVYHEDIGATKGLTLDGTAAATTASTFFNDTAPTSSVFTVGTGGRTNGSSDGMIAYCFAEVEGFSKIGSYTGNGSTNGPFIYTGFKPAFVIFKSSSNSPTGWGAIDNTRSPSNPVDDLLQPNFSSVESTSDNWDFLSNGFKVRTTWAAANGSGYTVTYMAFAESPFKTATAR